jgi:biopolymer transport protein ExbB
MLLPEPIIQAVDYLQSGGGVILPLIVISVWMWALIVRKWLEFYRLRSRERAAWECLERCEDRGFDPPFWQARILDTFRQYRARGKLPDRKVMARVRHSQEAEIERSVGAILVMAAVAPLLGLLGTVVGMIKTFDVISQFGTGNARAMAAGISEALISTQTGLIVAVPGLVMGNLLRRRAEGIKGRMERFALSLLREAQRGAAGVGHDGAWQGADAEDRESPGPKTQG